MYETSVKSCWWYDEEKAKAAQAAFEAMFPKGYKPHLDSEVVRLQKR